MKRCFILLSSLVLAGMIYGQQPADYLMRSKALIESGKPREAISLLSEGILKNQDYRLYLVRAEALIALGDYMKAADSYNSANSSAAASGEYGLARISAMKGDAVNSLKHLENNIGSAFRKSEKEIMLDAAFSLIENTPEWRQFWKKERYKVTERKLSEIEYYTSAGKTDDAGIVLRELTSQYPDDSNTLYAKALVENSGGRFGESINILSKLLETDKTNEKYLRLLAGVQSSSGNAAGASQSYSDLIGQGVPDAGLYLRRAECYSKTGETEKALKDITVYLSLYPENRSALSFAGRLEAQSGDNLKALDFFSRNLKLHPNDPECYTDRGNSYFMSKSWGYAISDYSMALDIQPLNSETWLNKGIALFNIGKTDDACHDFRAALNLGNKKATSYISRYCIK